MCALVCSCLCSSPVVSVVRVLFVCAVLLPSPPQQYELDVSRSYNEVHPSSLSAVDNMVAMEELSEAAILHNLRLRFDENLIYTHISNILVSINPFQALAIYGPGIMKEYRERLAKMEKVAPHVYSLAHAAYVNLRSESADQSVIISGESGAGKTEAMKLVLQYMAEMSGQGNDVEQQLLSSNPIIEAFGNAKTVRNNNSSRFGKLVEIKFNDRFHIVGANIKKSEAQHSNSSARHSSGESTAGRRLQSPITHSLRLFCVLFVIQLSSRGVSYRGGRCRRAQFPSLFSTGGRRHRSRS